jgi:NAD(P)-dependent dehydrogenase (short-subunit alcohol dehydrogenase family)
LDGDLGAGKPWASGTRGGAHHRRVDGLGRATALHLERLGFDVFAGVRREEDGERVAADSSGQCVPVLCDITDQAAIDAVAQPDG